MNVRWSRLRKHALDQVVLGCFKENKARDDHNQSLFFSGKVITFICCSSWILVVVVPEKAKCPFL